MKNIFLILFVWAIALVSCDQENMGTIYEPENSYVAFSSSVVPENILSAENNFSVNVQIVRSDLTSASTANVELEMNSDIDGVFALENNSVTFQDGEGVAYVKIVPVVDAALIDPTKAYTFKLTLTGDNVSEFYGQTTYKASFKYTPIGAGTFNSVFYEDEWTVDIEKLEVGNIVLYKARSLYETDYDITIVVDGENVTVDGQPAWYYDDEYGEVYVSGTGTISGKTLTMSLTHYIPDVFAWDPTTEVLTLP